MTEDKYLKYVTLAMVWLAMTFQSVAAFSQGKIEFYATPTVPLSAKTLQPYAIDFQDTLAGDTLYQVRSEAGYPVSYHRKIRTSVCFDNKCRLLNIIVHWNITGRYLGFELPPDEFLSKAEHTAFNLQEYERLHQLLAEPNSPLGSFSYNELVPSKPEMDTGIDAVSSPTARNLVEFVVEGAAYTTYKLWHIVYGVTRDEVSRLTADVLTPALLIKILESPQVSDKIWALNQRHRLQVTTPQIQEIILTLTGSEEFSLAEGAVEAIAPKDLEDADFQIRLLEKLDDANYSLKKRMIMKLREAPVVTAEASVRLAEKLMHVSGDLAGTILELFEEENIQNIEVIRRVARLLENENVFISGQAYRFLSRLPRQDKEIDKLLGQYRLRHSLKE